MWSYFPKVVDKDNSFQDFISVNTPEEFKSRKAEIMASLDKISEAGGTGETLKSVIENNDGTEEKSYHMVHKETNKVYEAKIKKIPITATKVFKIAVLKDQTIFEELVKRKMLGKYQKMLLSSITHEIRNPLNAIECFRSIILESLNLDEAKSACIKIGYAAQQIDFIMTGACDLMLSDSRSLAIHKDFINLQETIQQVICIISPIIESKSIVFRNVFGEGIPDRIISDPKKYQMILYHLLSNAAKYTVAGEIKLELQYNPFETKLITTVSDTGIGMNKKQLENAFKLYSNVESANVYNPQGMNMGLSLCKRLSKILGGDIEVKAEEGVGTHVTFSIKLNSDDSEAEEEVAYEGNDISFIQHIKFFASHDHEALQNTGSLMQIHGSIIKEDCKNDCFQALIVDDDPTNRLVLKTYLKCINVKTDEAENGKIGIEKVQGRQKNDCCKKYKLIVMDINMPVMDGTTATNILIRMFDQNPQMKTPILAVTAANFQTREDLYGLLSIGFVDISKKYTII